MPPRAVKLGTTEAFAELVKRPHAGIFEFPLFSAEYTRAILHEAHLFEHWCSRQNVSPTRPNSMNAHGVVLAELGLDGAMDELLDSWLAPLTAWAFPQHHGSSLDHQHSFLVEYAEEGDTELGFHVDDSRVLPVRIAASAAKVHLGALERCTEANIERHLAPLFLRSSIRSWATR